VSDILWQNEASGAVYEWQMSDGQHVAGADVSLGNLSGWQVAGIGDYDGNGTDGVLWQNQASGATYEWTFANGQHVAGADVFLGNLAPTSWHAG